MVVIEENVEFKTDFDKAKIAEDVVGEILKKEGVGSLTTKRYLQVQMKNPT